MKVFDWKSLSDADRKAVLSRPEAMNDPTVVADVATIMAAVKSDGDKAVLDYTAKFDGVTLDNLRVDMSVCEAAWKSLDVDDKAALETAKANIERFHSAQIPDNISVETMPGVTCRREARAISSAGLYVPGGTAPLVSTLLMLAIPAKVAGVTRRVIVTPPSKDGRINPAILAAAYLCDVTDIFACGGAQAIAALAYGTESIPACDKIFGPGNMYVAAAKSLAAQAPGGPAIDMPAGPSEAMVIADDTANPVFVASDLLSQAEHDKVAQVIGVCSTAAVTASIQDEINRQVATLPRRDIAECSLSFARLIIASERTDQLAIINDYAPEHLILQTKNPESYVGDIQNAGSIFLGPWTPESVGDYASGTNHTLPTYGAARAYSGVTLESFMKHISVQELTLDGLRLLGPTVERLANLEGLEAHRRAVSLRLESNQS
ncbi:MAG: histidinol dehydrogenase [Maricaulaceae bacterium]